MMDGESFADYGDDDEDAVDVKSVSTSTVILTTTTTTSRPSPMSSSSPSPKSIINDHDNGDCHDGCRGVVGGGGGGGVSAVAASACFAQPMPQEQSSKLPRPNPPPSPPRFKNSRSSPIHGLVKTIIGECLIGCDAFPMPATTTTTATTTDRASRSNGSGINRSDGQNLNNGGSFYSMKDFRLQQKLRLQGKKLGQRFFGCSTATSGAVNENDGDPSPTSKSSFVPQQFVQLQGLGIISLGALEDELSPQQRVWDTFQQSTTSSSRTDRLISIGYLVRQEEVSSEGNVRSSGDDNEDDIDVDNKKPNKKQQRQQRFTMTTQSIPYDVWVGTYPNEDPQKQSSSMSRPIRNLISKIQRQEFDSALVDLRKTCASQMMNPSVRCNAYMHGITLHNLAVLTILAIRNGSKRPSTVGVRSGGGGTDSDSNSYAEALSLFEQAVSVKRQVFGTDHVEVALSLNEMAITQFALERYEEAIASFSQSLTIYKKHHHHQRQQQLLHQQQTKNSNTPSNFFAGTASTQFQEAVILNNIACCQFQMRTAVQASLSSMMLARDLLQHNHTEHQHPTTADNNKKGGNSDIDGHDDMLMLDDDDEKKSCDSDNIACKFSITLDQEDGMGTMSRDGVGGSEARSDVDLLKMALILSNVGFIHFHVKHYDDARSFFEEALLLQESVLGDTDYHRAIRLNLEFTNAFHAE